MMQSCLWVHYHEKAPPSHCTYLTSDLPFVPPRQQIAAVVVAGPSVLNSPSGPRAGEEEWVGVFQSSCLMPKSIPIHPLLSKNTHRHTRSHTLNQTGWRTPSQQPFFATLLLSAPLFLVCVLMKTGGPMEGTWLGKPWVARLLHVYIFVYVCVHASTCLAL